MNWIVKNFESSLFCVLASLFFFRINYIASVASKSQAQTWTFLCCLVEFSHYSSSSIIIRSYLPFRNTFSRCIPRQQLDPPPLPSIVLCSLNDCTYISLSLHGSYSSLTYSHNPAVLPYATLALLPISHLSQALSPVRIRRMTGENVIVRRFQRLRHSKGGEKLG